MSMVDDDMYVRTALEVADILEDYLRRHPEHQHLTQGKYDVKPPGNSVADLITLEPSLNDVIKDTEPETAALYAGCGLSGMMWDIALTEARNRLKLGPTPLISIVEIEAGGA